MQPIFSGAIGFARIRHGMDRSILYHNDPEGLKQLEQAMAFHRQQVEEQLPVDVCIEFVSVPEYSGKLINKAYIGDVETKDLGGKDRLIKSRGWKLLWFGKPAETWQAFVQRVVDFAKQKYGSNKNA